jgi:hypothetical protein
MAGLVIREPGNPPRVRGCGATSGAPDGRLLSAARLLRLASDASAVPRATLSNRSRSRWLKAIRSVSMGPSATYESGHFYFAQTGHSHFAATQTYRNRLIGT